MVAPGEAVSITPSDNYCAAHEICLRSFEAFKFLHPGMSSEIPRMSLPAIARSTGLANDRAASLLTESPGQ